MTRLPEPVRWALVGSSEFALDWVLPALRSADGAKPVAIVTRDPAALTSRRPDVTDLAIATSLRELDAVGVDIVHVITPNDLHLPLTLEALRLGLDVLVEKPMALSLAEASSMRRSADDAGRLLAVGSCMAWSPAIQCAGEVVRAGGLGEVGHAQLTAGFDARPNPGWRQMTPTADGGGVLNDLGPHAIDALSRILGPVTSISAQLTTQTDSFGADDTAVLVMHHTGGADSLVHLSFRHSCNDLNIAGSSGQLTGKEWLGRRFTGHLVLSHGDAGAADFGTDGPLVETQTLEFVDVLERQAVEVSSAVRAAGVPPHASVEQGLHVMAALQAAQRSSAARGMVTDV